MVPRGSGHTQQRFRLLAAKFVIALCDRVHFRHTAEDGLALSAAGANGIVKLANRPRLANFTYLAQYPKPIGSFLVLRPALFFRYRCRIHPLLLLCSVFTECL